MKKKILGFFLKTETAFPSSLPQNWPKIPEISYIPLLLLMLAWLTSCYNKQPHKVPSLNQTSISSTTHMLHKDKYAKLCKQGFQFSCQISAPEWQQLPRLSILQGLTWLNGAYVNVVASNQDKRQYWLATQYKDNIDLKKIKFTNQQIAHSKWVIESLQVPLKGEFHDLIVVGSKEVLDLRRIEGRHLSAKEYRLAFTSCMDHNFNQDQDKLWTSLSQDNPDYLFLLGDNVYATKALDSKEKFLNKARLSLKYLAMRRRLLLYHLPKLIPILAIWDDHDYGMSDGNKIYPYKRAAKKVFHSFFAQPNQLNLFEHGPAETNSALFHAFGTQFFLMDNRSQREPKQTDSGQFAHWGAEQENWLFTKLKEKPNISWLLNGDQIFGGYHKFESFEGDHPKSFQKFLFKWKKSKVPLIFVSGDRHLTELMEISPPDSLHKTYEITASPAHAKTYPSRWAKKPNPRQIIGADLKLNYVIVDSQRLETKQKLKITAKGKDGKKLYSKKVSVDWTKKDEYKNLIQSQ